MTLSPNVVLASDSSYTPIILSLLLVLLVILTVLAYYGGSNLPPGPRGLPLVGVLPLMGSRPYLTVQRWWHRYGDVVSVYMGSRLVLIVSGLETMKECFVRQADVFSGRPDSYFKRLTKGKGLVFNEGEAWKEHRRFAISCLRDFGMGKIVLQHTIHDEIEYLLRELMQSTTHGHAIDPGSWLSRAASNVICSIIYGTRFDYGDESFCGNVYNLNESARNQTLTNLINFIPWLEFLPTILPTNRMLKRNVQQRALYAQMQVNERRQMSLDSNNPRDFIEAYLIRMEQLHRNGEQTTFNESQLQRAIQDLFIAGTESVGTTLKWAILFMSLHPDIQYKVQSEIDSVIGRNRMPSMSDRVSLPFTEATLMECQRVGNIALFNVPRCTTADTVVNGYRVPCGTWVFTNRWGLHQSTRYWTNPSQFDPCRFIDNQGHVVRHEALTPFGMGPRSCLGESLAKMELFLFFSCLVQSFTFQLPPGTDVDSVAEPKMGLNLCPHPYNVIITHRS